MLDALLFSMELLASRFSRLSVRHLYKYNYVFIFVDEVFCPTNPLMWPVSILLGIIHYYMLLRAAGT